MLQFADVNGVRRRPFKGGKGICPTCGGAVTAKCGKIKVHHWAHESIENCDPWSEHVGEWHKSWQEIVQEEYVEVSMGTHRADIQNTKGTVIELQHSPISPDEIACREDFYGDMVWVFDAKERFPVMPSGPLAFFSLERTKHITSCQKDLFLDCRECIIQVVCFTELLSKFSGYGVIRDKGWFVSTYLDGCVKPDRLSPSTNSLPKWADSWRSEQPWRLTDFTSKWRDPETGEEKEIVKKTPYIPLKYKWSTQPNPVWYDVIADHKKLSNGWDVDSLKEMKILLTGTPMILDGLLRVMPARFEEMQAENNVSVVQLWIEKARTHMEAGRIPILREKTFEGLVERAKRYEIEKYGHLLQPDDEFKRQLGRQRSLFD